MLYLMFQARFKYRGSCPRLRLSSDIFGFAYYFSFLSYFQYANSSWLLLLINKIVLSPSLLPNFCFGKPLVDGKWCHWIAEIQSKVFLDRDAVKRWGCSLIMGPCLTCGFLAKQPQFQWPTELFCNEAQIVHVWWALMIYILFVCKLNICILCLRFPLIMLPRVMKK